jgi:hypothetical protein
VPKINYPNTSRLYATPQASWFLGLYVSRSFQRDGTDVPITLSSRYNFRPDLLSYDLYGTVNYRWTFMVLNPGLIRDPIFDMVTGLTIYTATPDRLHTQLGA